MGEVYPVHEAGQEKGREAPREDDAGSSLLWPGHPHLTGNTPNSPWERDCQKQVRSQGMIPVGHTDLGYKLTPPRAAFPFQLYTMPLQLKCKAFIPSIISIIFNEEKKI